LFLFTFSENKLYNSAGNFFEEHGEGAHHVCYNVEDLDKEISDMASRGYQVTQTGTTGTVKWAYFDTDKDGSIVVELGSRVK
jgi:methylmalonyl-CoA/ethylmalonyl-CoA epimerase